MLGLFEFASVYLQLMFALGPSEFRKKTRINLESFVCLDTDLVVVSVLGLLNASAMVSLNYFSKSPFLTGILINF